MSFRVQIFQIAKFIFSCPKPIYPAWCGGWVSKNKRNEALLCSLDCIGTGEQTTTTSTCEFRFRTVFGCETKLTLVWRKCREIWEQSKSSFKEKKMDIHTRLMSRYRQVPEWWFWLILVVNIAATITACEYYNDQLQLPWWGVLLACAIAIVFTLPIGIITAITNQVRPLFHWTNFPLTTTQLGFWKLRSWIKSIICFSIWLDMFGAKFWSRWLFFVFVFLGCFVISLFLLLLHSHHCDCFYTWHYTHFLLII